MSTRREVHTYEELLMAIGALCAAGAIVVAAMFVVITLMKIWDTNSTVHEVRSQMRYYDQSQQSSPITPCRIKPNGDFECK